MYRLNYNYKSVMKNFNSVTLTKPNPNMILLNIVEAIAIKVQLALAKIFLRIKQDTISSGLLG